MKNRRTFIKSTALISTGLIAQNSFAFSINKKTVNPDDMIVGHNGFRYKVDKDWAKISPSTTPLINCHEMVQDSQGRLVMIGDDTHNNILVFDKSGKLLESWGSSFPAGHGLTISKENGEDFLLLVDNGFYTDLSGASKSQPGNVVKTNIKGRIIFSLAQPHAIGVYEEKDTYHPTETAVAPNGDIYVADGYGSDYILHYDSKGRFMPGMFVCRPVLHGDNIYAGVCWSKDKEGKKNSDTGFLTILDKSNKVLASPGGTAPVYEKGILQQTFQDPSRVFKHGHDVCIDEDDSIYVCQWNASKTPPIKLTRV